MQDNSAEHATQPSTAFRDFELDASALAGLEPLGRRPGRNRTKADVLRYRIAGRDVAVKDYHGRPWWIRWTIGRWLVRREARAYRAVAGLPGLPAFLGSPGPLALATAWIDAAPLARLGPGALSSEHRRRLDELLDRLHARGVALGDLHQGDVLLGADDAVWVVDLATAFVLGPRPGALRRKLFARWVEADRVALARLGARAEGRDPDTAFDGLAPATARWHRSARRLQQWSRRLRRRLGGRRRRRGDPDG